MVTQSEASPTADQGVASSIPAWSLTFVEIDHGRISTDILLLPMIQYGLLSITSESMCTKLVKLAREKSVVRWTDRPNMTIIVDLEVKPQNNPPPPPPKKKIKQQTPATVLPAKRDSDVMFCLQSYWGLI